jgi:hypothetical protein
MKTSSIPKPTKEWRETLDCVSPLDPTLGKLSLPTCRKDRTACRIVTQDVPAASITHDELWAAIDAAYDTDEDRPVPKGWCTAQEYAARKGIGRMAVCSRLDRLVQKGTLQTAIRTLVIGGVRRKVRVYGLVSANAEK